MHNRTGVMGSTIHSVNECKGADMNKVAYRVYAISVLFQARLQAGEGARSWCVWHIPPLSLLGLVGERERIGGGVCGVHHLRVVLGVILGIERCWRWHVG